MKKRIAQNQESLSSEGLHERRTRLSDIQRRKKDQRLWDALPRIDDPYDQEKLSERELLALEEAMGDGFGNRSSSDARLSGLPKKVHGGLLKHSYYTDERSDYDPEVDENGDYWDHEFWAKGSDDAPAPSEYFPLNFDRIRLRIYFRSQFERFCHRVITVDDYDHWDVVEDEWVFADLCLRELYRKSWYELHALQFLDYLDSPIVTKQANFTLLMNTSFAGKLGRLVEQYYWRFRYEGIAIKGLRARNGASVGGKARAQKVRKESARWQKIADEIWARRPDLRTSAVAKLIKRELQLKQTVKHIGRYIRLNKT